MLPPPLEKRRGTSGRLYSITEKWLNGLDDFYRRSLEKALHHRPTVLATGTALFVVSLLLLPTIPFELMPQTDEGEVSVDVELPVGTRIERTEAVDAPDGGPGRQARCPRRRRSCRRPAAAGSWVVPPTGAA